MGGVSRFAPLCRLSFHLRCTGDERAFSSSTANWLVSAVGASGFPAVDVRWVPWLVSGVEVDFEFFTFFFFEADEGVTHSLDLDDILIGCEVHDYGLSYRRRQCE